MCDLQLLAHTLRVAEALLATPRAAGAVDGAALLGDIVFPPYFRVVGFIARCAVAAALLARVVAALVGVVGVSAGGDHDLDSFVGKELCRGALAALAAAARQWLRVAAPAAGPSPSLGPAAPAAWTPGWLHAGSLHWLTLLAADREGSVRAAALDTLAAVVAAREGALLAHVRAVPALGGC